MNEFLLPTLHVATRTFTVTQEACTLSCLHGTDVASCPFLLCLPKLLQNQKYNPVIIMSSPCLSCFLETILTVQNTPLHIPTCPHTKAVFYSLDFELHKWIVLSICSVSSPLPHCLGNCSLSCRPSSWGSISEAFLVPLLPLLIVLLLFSLWCWVLNSEPQICWESPHPTF